MFWIGYFIKDLIELAHNILPFVNCYLLIILVKNSNYLRHKNEKGK